MALSEIRRLRLKQILDWCDQERTRILSSPYEAEPSLRLTSLDELERLVWDIVEQEEDPIGEFGARPR